MAKVPVRFVRETLGPEFEKSNELLRSFLDDVTDRVIKQAVYSDSSEADVVEDRSRLLAEDDSG